MVSIAFWIIPIVIVVAALVHIGVAARPLQKGRVLEIWLVHLLFWGHGVGYWLFAAAFAFPPFSHYVAEQFGVAPDGTFQVLLAANYLSFGVIGILAPIFRGGFWLAGVIAAFVVGITQMVILIVYQASFVFLWMGIIYDGVGAVVMIIVLLLYRIRAGERFWNPTVYRSTVKSGRQK